MTLTEEKQAQVILDTFQHEISRNGHKRDKVKNCSLYLVDMVIRQLDINCCPKREINYWKGVKSHIEKYDQTPTL